jgi:hypothetical protein
VSDEPEEIQATKVYAIYSPVCSFVVLPGNLSVTVDVALKIADEIRSAVEWINNKKTKTQESN